MKFYPSLDGTHTPTGYNIYTDSSMTTLLASNTDPEMSVPITLSLNPPMLLEGVYVQILKSTQWQIWLEEVEFYTAGTGCILIWHL